MKKILIVDDNEEHLYLLENIIKQTDYEVELATNGKEALEILKRNKIIMIISDILMPVMDGFQLCKSIRKNEDFKDLIFVFHSATYTSKEDEKLAIKIGANKFLKKPTDPEKIIEIINELIQKKKSGQLSSTKLANKDEKEVLELYNKQLVKKLEKKVFDLEKSEFKYKEAYTRAEFYKDLIAHDIKNILHGISIGIELIESFQNKPDRENILEHSIIRLKKEALRATLLISNLGKLSQLEENEEKLSRLEIYDILLHVIETVKENCSHKKLNIKLSSFRKEIFVLSNCLIADVFKNLLINAIKHNENKNIEIHIKISRTQKNQIKYIKFEFKDNGIGVEEHRKIEIFQRGYSKNRKILGKEISLPVVKRIIENLKGIIWVEDSVKNDSSRGSNFILLLPEA